MGTLQEDLEGIDTIEDKVVKNKVARFAYTEKAYKDNDADGVEEYDINKEQNIPVGYASVMKVNETVLNRGYRAQASSITRMLMNHFLGRLSYNLNKVNDVVSSFIKTVKGHLGSANGIATLDATGRIPYAQLPESTMEFKGTWDASTNTPTLTDGTGRNGNFYVVSVAGTQTFGGVEINFNTNDRIIYNGATSSWTKLSSGDVRTVNSIKPDAKGNIKLDAPDVNAVKTINSRSPDKKTGNISLESLSINGQSFNGSAAVSVGTMKMLYGGTGATDEKGAEFNITAGMDSQTSDFTDTTKITCVQESPSASTGRFFYSKASYLWNYIKDKISSVLGLTASNYGGTALMATNAEQATRASTAEIADKTVNDITLTIPFAQKDGEYVIPLGNIPEPASSATASPYNWDITGFLSIIRTAGHNGLHLWFEAGHGYSHAWTTYAYLDKLDVKLVATSIKAFQYEGKWCLGLCIITANQGYTAKMTITYSRGSPATPTCILYNSASDGVANTEIYNSIQDIPSSWWKERTIYNPTTFNQNITAPVIQATTNFIGNVSGNSETATTADKVKNALTINGQSFDGSSPVTVDTPNTDTKVTQTVSTESNNYPILASATANKSSSSTETAIFSTLLKMNPFSGNITGWSNGSACAICSTAASVQDKVINLPGLTLTTGMTVNVFFSNGNSAEHPRLKVNSNDAIPIYTNKQGNLDFIVKDWDAGISMTLMFKGDSFVVLGNPIVELKLNLVTAGSSATRNFIRYASGLLIQWGTVIVNGLTQQTIEAYTSASSYSLLATPSDGVIGWVKCLRHDKNIIKLGITASAVAGGNYIDGTVSWLTIGW